MSRGTVSVIRGINVLEPRSPHGPASRRELIGVVIAEERLTDETRGECLEVPRHGSAGNSGSDTPPGTYVHQLVQLARGQLRP